jgi:phosphate transport system substrate-binding protein
VLAQWLTFTLLALFAGQICAQQGTPARPAGARTLVISGSPLLAPLISAIASRFENENQNVTVTVRVTGSSRGIAEMRSGTADIAMAARPSLETESDLYSFPIVRDGVAVLVHRENTLRNITTRQLSQLLTGRITTWKALGGADTPVNLAWRTKGEGSTEFILHLLQLRREQIRPHVMIFNNADAIKFVAADRNGVALASVAEAERRARAGDPIKLLDYNGFPAASRTVQNHTYALSRPLTLSTLRLPDGVEKAFIDCAMSPKVIDLQLSHGFVPY